MLTSKQEMKLAKTVCYALRHRPEEFNLELDSHGYVTINGLIEGINAKEKKNYSKEDLLVMTKNDEKGRYKVKGNFIRCQFGHSIQVDLGDSVDNIPDVLIHGTAKKNVPSIMKFGMKPKSRNRVHLTSDVNVAKNVGMRYAKTEENLSILSIDVKSMIDDGIKVYSTQSSTFLVDEVPPKYISETTL